MRSQTWPMAGAAVVAAGVLMLGMVYATSGVVHAGVNAQVPCDQTPFTGTNPDVVRVGIAAQPDSVVPQCTETPRKVRTHTPTATPTEPPKTNTPVPSTATSTNTPKAASEAVSVKPPNTGLGNGGSGDMTLWLLALGAAAVAFGGGAVLVGVRRRSP